MSSKVKIVVAAINAACLAVTLIFPSSATPFAVLITIVTVTSWAFTTYGKSGLGRLGLSLYVIMASLLAMLCLVVGMSSSIEPVDANKMIVTNAATQSIDHYVFQVSKESFIWANKMIDYTNIAIAAFALVVMLMILEIFATTGQSHREGVSQAGEKALPITSYIENQIGHIK